MADRAIRLLTLDDATMVSPNIRRLRFSGASLTSFPSGFEGGYVKLLFDAEGRALETDDASVRPAARRSYTVRAVDPEARTLTLEAALHTVPGGRLGPATRWVATAQPGARIAVMGPGPVKRLSPDADHVVAVADPTGLAALAVNLEVLPATARGFAIVEVLAEGDRRDLERPEGVDVQWVVSATPRDGTSALIQRLVAAPWPSGRVSFWGAGEFEVVREMRRYVLERGVQPEDLYLSSYWKRGATDEQHKLAKKQAAATA
ncbi:MAG: siderophore-interacting protein [Myxococcota bacterium]